jgi:hypothetical protein
MAGMDATLLALAGVGHSGRRTFGFASCERAVGAAEGMNVLMETQATDADGAHAAALPPCSQLGTLAAKATVQTLERRRGPPAFPNHPYDP